MRYFWIISCCVLLSGCTFSVAGPFVRNISRTQNNDLVIEKCDVSYDWWMGRVVTGNCTTQTI